MEWQTGVEYKTGQIVSLQGKEYECLKDHKSNVFGIDLHGKNEYPGIWQRVDAREGRYN